MKPLVLNEFGETLCFDTSFAADENMLLERMGLVHGACCEPVELHRVSETHSFIFCSLCGRVPNPAYIPNEIDTPAKLRQWCEGRIKEKDYNRTKLNILWGLVPIDVKNKIRQDIELYEAEKQAAEVVMAASGRQL